MRYVIVVEKAENNYSAYVPDLLGCVATGDTIEEAEREIRTAIELYLESMIEDGLPIPQPTSLVGIVNYVAFFLFICLKYKAKKSKTYRKLTMPKKA